MSPTVGAPATVPGTVAKHVAVLGQLDVVEPDLTQLLDEQPREVELLGRRRVRRRVGSACVSMHDVAEEALEHVLGAAPRRAGSRSAFSQAARTGGAARRSSRARRGGRAAGMFSFGEWSFELGRREARDDRRDARARPSAATTGIDPPERMSSGRVAEHLLERVLGEPAQRATRDRRSRARRSTRARRRASRPPAPRRAAAARRPVRSRPSTAPARGGSRRLPAPPRGAPSSGGGATRPRSRSR